MSALSISVPYPVFSGQDGLPLDNGYVWIGTANLYPITNPIAVYFDEALTIQATQPLRTINGFISNAGTPAQVYVDAVNFSILVQDSKGSMVYNFPDGAGIVNAANVIYGPAGTNAVATTAQTKMREYISRNDYNSQAAAIQQTIESTKIYLNNSETFTLTVGVSADVATINEAVNVACRMQPVYSQNNTLCVIELQTGFTMQEQLLLDGGTDLGWIKITSVDAVVPIDPAYVTVYLDQPDDLIPAFGAKNNSTLPIIGCQFAMLTTLQPKTEWLLSLVQKLVLCLKLV